MFHWVYALSTGTFLYGGPYEAPFDPVTQGVLLVDRHPKPRLERYNGAGGIRPATAQEIADYDAAALIARTAERFDSEQLVKALAIWTAQKLSVPLATAKQEILAIYRQL
jgi:hypothetical protein